ncbi:MAG: bifunctional [glutamate--ammonia ligase]-adenylyl-L-tyrosine phosphorylase/[glutamate--ammonia-ligase] adenylyltransferase [Gammaproteobacteria bacterium]|nr:bifunctional [glutamate--ammonia ligase]-adenylyl-L-tyrosine phosphorylase/[glutamate--ammonia-ligase] adenylyltransferase [Gammaproteobacteria bacterium]
MISSNSISETWQQLLAGRNLTQSALQVLAGSDYLKQWGQRYPERAKTLIESGDIEKVYEIDTYQQNLVKQLNNVADEAVLQQQLRYFRQREMVRIIWRDLAGWSDLAETMRDLSAMADACIQQALSKLQYWLELDLGQPVNDDGQPQSMIVLGMGKLGAGELNLSSDIDLIFCYPDNGDTQGGRRSLSNEEFFTRLGRKLIHALDTITVDGFVFRVDMRLRPYGDSGSLALSFDAMEYYYQTQGREWERYALIKARPITGDHTAQQQLIALLRPFVYRRYLDYGVFASLRELKAMIAGQLHKKGMEDNIKLGAGGIREIEFIGQVFQLIYGGRDLALQQRPILTILDLLAQRQFLSNYVVAQLQQAYDFLRRTEHRIQAWADQQTHILPQDDDSRYRLANSMGFANWCSYKIVLDQHRNAVQSHFEQVLTAPQADIESNGVSFFTSSKQQQLEHLQRLGYHDTEKCLDALKMMLNSRNCRNLSETGRERLVRLLPLLVQASANVAEPDMCLSRLIPLMEAIMRRSAYMSLLVENPLALSQLVKLYGSSSWIGNNVTKHPVLLDALLDPRALYSVPERSEQKAVLSMMLDSVEQDDLEQKMEKLREFQQLATLHVAAADISNLLPVMRVGDLLTELAELQLEQVMQLAWQYLVTKHGKPPATDDTDLSQSGFVVLGYGKLGGLEMGYGSDLDLVFLYRDFEQNTMTDGDKPIDVMMFYTRLAQRMIHIINTITASGLLYEIDMRLRPNGNSGLLLSTVSGFAEYQQHDAWTWEHQALVRARCVAGDRDLSDKVAKIRCDVLTKQRDQTALALEVNEMRAKMRAQLDKSTGLDTGAGQLFDLKQGVGGIADIEFMVQYAVLAWSVFLPELLVNTDNIRILDALKSTGKLADQDARLLADAYRFYRHLANHCVLQDVRAIVPIENVAIYQPYVATLWQKWFG